MQIKQVAELLGVDKKDVIAEVEDHRDEFVSQGHKIAKKLTAASALDEALVRHILANFDRRKQEELKKEKALQDRREREEAERRRAAEQMKRKQEEEERKQREEAARKAAQVEIARRQAEMARQREESERRSKETPAPAAPPAAETPAPPPPQAQEQKPIPAQQQPASRPQHQRPAARAEQPPKQKEEKPAPGKGVAAFLEKGLEPTVTDDYKRQRRTRPAKEKAKEREEPRDTRPRRKGPPPSDGRRRFRPSQIFNVEQDDRRGKGAGKRKGPDRRRDSGYGAKKPEAPKVIKLVGDFTVGQFAEKTGIGMNEVMKKLIQMGQMLTVNALMEPDLAEELALEFEIEIELVRETDEADVEKYVKIEEKDVKLTPRPPVVTVMGHVDHGKTSLLDRIRQADVASSEYGGITQHIGAYNVQTQKGDIVFLDTPGHEAFTEMRSRGATVTDLVILVVAANDSVMPQTVEAINHAKAAGVPILVALNKTDIEGANPDRVKQDLMRHELVPEEYGGDTVVVPVSAITGSGIDDLLEYIALQTDMLELSANPARNALGAVIESNIDPNRGALATILVQEGTLKIGDHFICGTEYGRVRAMRDERGKDVEAAGPATPVEILGLRGSPEAGEQFVVVPTEAEARDIAERRMSRRKVRKVVGKQHLTLDNLAEQMTEDDILTLNLIVKGDVQGSVEAIIQALYRIKSDKVAIKVLHSGVGAVSQADVQLADASEAIILAFNVNVAPAARDASEEMGVEIRSYQVIYALLEDIEKAMVGMLEPEYEEKEEGRAKVLQIFKVSKVGTIAGCFVEEGNVAINHYARLIRDGSVIWRGKLESLRRVKDNVRQVVAGLECGISLKGYNDVKEGDEIETYSLVEQKASLIVEPEKEKQEKAETMS